MQNELDDAKKTLEQMKKKKIPELIVGQMYEVDGNVHNHFCHSKILILRIVNHQCWFIQFFDDNDDGNISFDTLSLETVNDGTLIAMNSPEQKTFSKQLFEFTKHYA